VRVNYRWTRRDVMGEGRVGGACTMMRCDGFFACDELKVVYFAMGSVRRGTMMEL
jgi:hypothetical protein